MIHYVSGKLAKLTGSYAVVDCGGVGFKIGISFSTGAKLSPLSGKNVLLYTYMAVSEDNMSLYGFFEEDELELFKMLISVSGVGPKGAMSILGTLSPDELRSAVAHGDAKTIASAQGIGLKTAQKLIIELKDKLVQRAQDMLKDVPGNIIGSLYTFKHWIITEKLGGNEVNEIGRAHV